MNVFQKLTRWTLQKAAGYAGVSFTLSDQNLNQKLGGFFGTGSYTGRSITVDASMANSVVWACVRLLSETMGAMPSKIFRMEKSGNVTPADDHRLNEVLVHQPNTEMNGLEFREARTANLALRGNQVAIIERGGDGNVSSLYPVPLMRKRDASTNWEVKYGVTDRGKTEWYPVEKVWHTKGFSFNGLEGLSAIAYARETLGLALAGEEFNARLFGQGLMPSARITIPQWLTPEQRKVANEKLLEMHTGMVNMNKPMLLEGGMQVAEGLISPDDAQFLQLRQFTVIEICRWFNIKPHMVASLEQATNNNIEHLSLEFVTYTMLPYMARDEKGARKLFKPEDRDKFLYRYNADGLLRADAAARAPLYSTLLQNSVLTPNEVRALENRNRSEEEGMDSFRVQSNMISVEDLKLIADKIRGTSAAPGKGNTP